MVKVWKTFTGARVEVVTKEGSKVEFESTDTEVSMNVGNHLKFRFSKEEMARVFMSVLKDYAFESRAVMDDFDKLNAPKTPLEQKGYRAAVEELHEQVAKLEPELEPVSSDEIMQGLLASMDKHIVNNLSDEASMPEIPEDERFKFVEGTEEMPTGIEPITEDDVPDFAQGDMPDENN
jgi:hypothetical protein